MSELFKHSVFKAPDNLLEYLQSQESVIFDSSTVWPDQLVDKQKVNNDFPWSRLKRKP